MNPKTILVCPTTPENAETLLKLAVPIAQANGAHLIGMHTIETLLVYPGIAMHIPDIAFDAFKDSQQKETDAIRAVFAKHTDAEVFPSEFRVVRAETASAGERMVESARAADLVIMAQDEAGADGHDQRNAQAMVIRNSGRPVIVVPPDYSGPTLGQNIVLGWSDTREAARAAHDMIDIAAKGADVTVVRVADAAKDALADSDAIEIAETLSRHGLKPTLEQRNHLDSKIADVLNQAAFEKGADLIVTGAFGHSRAYDFVIGATTDALLGGSKVPVLFSK